MKVWTKRHFLKLKSGKSIWTFTSEKMGQNLVIECTKDGWWLVSNSPCYIMKEVFYPVSGCGQTLKEAMAEFRFEINRTDYKNF